MNSDAAKQWAGTDRYNRTYIFCEEFINNIILGKCLYWKREGEMVDIYVRKIRDYEVDTH